jgi:hypothetical protein
MARRKRTTKKSHTPKRRRRSRVGAISSDNKTLLTTALAGIAGAVGGAYLNSAVVAMAEKSDSTKDYANYLGAAAQMGAGYFLPKLVKQNSPMIKGLQMGLLINGGLSLVKAANVLPGVGAVTIDNFNSVPMVAGYLDDARSETIPMVAGAGTIRRNMMSRNRMAARMAMA